MILFDDVVQVLDLPQFTGVGKGLFLLQFVESLWIGRIFIDSDHTRGGGMRRSQRFREKALRRFAIACHTQEELERVSLRIHCAIEVHPHLFYFHIGLIDAPGVIGCAEVRLASFLSFRSILLNPAIDRGMVHVQTPLPHHLFQVAIAERISQVPADAEQNEVGFVMTPFERVLIVHVGNSSVFLNRSRAYHITSIFATERSN